MAFPRGKGRARLLRVVPRKSSLRTTPARRERVWLVWFDLELGSSLAQVMCGVCAMNPFRFAIRRPVITLMLVVTLVGGGVLGCSKMQAGSFPPLNMPKVHMYLDYIGTNAKQVKEYIVGQLESYFQKHEEQHQRSPVRSSLPAPRPRTSPSPSDMSARSTRSATSTSVPWTTGISRRS